MVPDRQKVWTAEARTTPKLYPSDFVRGIIIVNCHSLNGQLSVDKLKINQSNYNHPCSMPFLDESQPLKIQNLGIILKTFTHVS